MNIVYLKDSFDPSFRNRDEVQIALQAAGHSHNVSIITTDYDLDLKKDMKNLLEKDKKLMPGIMVYRRNGFKLPFANSISYQPGIDTLEKKADIIFVHNIGSGSSFKIPSKRTEDKIKIILKADLNKQTYEHIKRSMSYRKIITRPIKRVDSIICFSEKEKSYLSDLGVPPGKISIIPVGIDIENVPDLSSKKGIDHKKLTIGILARMIAEKGQTDLVEPMKKLLKEYPEIRFIAAGPKTDEKYANKFIDELSRYNNFKYAGEIEYSSIYSKFFKMVDVVVVPSLEETGSITTLEAMACGKVVIASDINPHNVYIKNGKNGFLAKNTDDYYKYCTELLSDRGKIHKIGSEARSSVKKYDWSKIGDLLEELYRKLTTRN